MSSLPYTEAHEAFRRRLSAFLAAEITPCVDQWEKDHQVPRSAWRKMGENGFLCTSVDQAYGGLGGDFLYATIGIEEFSHTNHTGLIAPLHSDIVVPYIESYGTEAQKRKYLPGCVSGELVAAVAMTEPGAGSDVAAMVTSAVEEGGEVVINGSKTFISNGVSCDVLVLAARDPAVENPYQAISLYVVEADTPGFRKGARLEKMGMHSQDTAELFFTNCRIPVSNRLGEKGNGFIMLMKKLQQERLVCSVWAQARTEYILDWTVDYCRRTQVNGKPLSKYQSVQFDLVEMTTEARISRSFVEQLVADHVAGKEVVTETSMAKYRTSDMVNEVADRCINLMGMNAFTGHSPLIREWRDVRVMPIFAGTNEIMKGIVAKSMKL